MNHALIIEENLVVAKALEQQLLDAGFRSFDYAWSEDDAVATALLRHPDLVVVGDNVESGSGIEAARRIREHQHVPVILATACAGARQPLPQGVAIEGPFPLRDLRSAIDLATTEALAGLPS